MAKEAAFAAIKVTSSIRIAGDIFRGLGSGPRQVGRLKSMRDFAVPIHGSNLPQPLCSFRACMDYYVSQNPRLSFLKNTLVWVR